MCLLDDKIILVYPHILYDNNIATKVSRSNEQTSLSFKMYPMISPRRFEVPQAGPYASHRLQSITQPVPTSHAAFDYSPIIPVYPSGSSVNALPVTVSSPPLGSPQVIYLQQSRIYQQPISSQGILTSPPAANSSPQKPLSFQCIPPSLSLGVPMAPVNFQHDPRGIEDMPIQPVVVSSPTLLVAPSSSTQTSFPLTYQVAPQGENNNDSSLEDVLVHTNRGFPLPVTPYGYIERGFQQNMSVVDTLVDGSKKEFMITRAEKVSLWRTFASAFHESKTKLEATDNTLLAIFLGLPSHIRKAVRHKGGIGAILRECPWFYVRGDVVELVPAMEKLYQCQDDDVKEMSPEDRAEESDNKQSLTGVLEDSCRRLSISKRDKSRETGNRRPDKGHETPDLLMMRQEKKNVTREKGDQGVGTNRREMLDGHLQKNYLEARDGSNKMKTETYTVNSHLLMEGVQNRGREEQKWVAMEMPSDTKESGIRMLGLHKGAESAATCISSKFEDVVMNNEDCDERVIEMGDGSWYIVNKQKVEDGQAEVKKDGDCSSPDKIWDDNEATAALRELIMNNARRAEDGQAEMKDGDCSSPCLIWDENEATAALRQMIMNTAREVGTYIIQERYAAEGKREDEVKPTTVENGDEWSGHRKTIQTDETGCRKDDKSSSTIDVERCDVCIQTSLLVPPAPPKTMDRGTHCNDLVPMTETTSMNTDPIPQKTECDFDRCKRILACCRSDLKKITLEQRETDAHLSHATSKLKHVESENKRLKDELSSVIADLIRVQVKPKREDKTTSTDLNFDSDLIKKLQGKLSEAKQNLLHWNLKNIDLQAKLALQLISQAYEESEIIYSMKKLSIAKKASLTMQMMKYHSQLHSSKDTVDGWKLKSERYLASGGSLDNLPPFPSIDIAKFELKPSIEGPLRKPSQPSAANIKLAAKFSNSASVPARAPQLPQKTEEKGIPKEHPMAAPHAEFSLAGSAGSESNYSKIPLTSTFMPNSKSDRPGTETKSDCPEYKFGAGGGNISYCHLTQDSTKQIPAQMNNPTATSSQVDNRLGADRPATPLHNHIHSGPAIPLRPSGGLEGSNQFQGYMPNHRDIPITSTSETLPKMQPANVRHTEEKCYDERNPYFYSFVQPFSQNQHDIALDGFGWIGQPIDVSNDNTQGLPTMDFGYSNQSFTRSSHRLNPVPGNAPLEVIQEGVIQGICGEQTLEMTAHEPPSSMEYQSFNEMQHVPDTGSGRVTSGIHTQAQKQYPMASVSAVDRVGGVCDKLGGLGGHNLSEASFTTLGAELKSSGGSQEGERTGKVSLKEQDMRPKENNMFTPTNDGYSRAYQPQPPMVEVSNKRVMQQQNTVQAVGPSMAVKNDDGERDLEFNPPPPSPKLQRFVANKENVLHPNQFQRMETATVNSQIGLDTFDNSDLIRVSKTKTGGGPEACEESGWLKLGSKRKKRSTERQTTSREMGSPVRGQVRMMERPPVEDDVIPVVFSMTHLLKKLSDMFPSESRLSLTSAILKVRANHRGQLDKVPYAIIISEATVILTSPNDNTRKDRTKGVACKLDGRSQDDVEPEPRIAPKGNLLPKLLKKLVETFPTKAKKDLIDGIVQVRKTHGGTLAGITMTQVIFEVSMILKSVGTVQDSEDGEDKNCCSICLGSLKSPQPVRELECLHTFHDECIQCWFQKRERTCPVCRSHALLHDDFPRLN